MSTYKTSEERGEAGIYIIPSCIVKWNVAQCEEESKLEGDRFHAGCSADGTDVHPLDQTEGERQ